MGNGGDVKRILGGALLLTTISSTGWAQVPKPQPRPATQPRPAAQPAPAPQPASAALRAAANNNRMVVYKTPTCGCCTAWINYVRNAGFTVEVHDLADLTEIKRNAGVPDQGASCHTAQIGGYFVEGHVPVEDIRRMLAERPDIRGIAAPGMPVGSPGMEAGDRRDRYEVKAVNRDGTATVWARHN